MPKPTEFEVDAHALDADRRVALLAAFSRDLTGAIQVRSRLGAGRGVLHHHPHLVGSHNLFGHAHRAVSAPLGLPSCDNPNTPRTCCQGSPATRSHPPTHLESSDAIVVINPVDILTVRASLLCHHTRLVAINDNAISFLVILSKYMRKNESVSQGVSK